MASNEPTLSPGYRFLSGSGFRLVSRRKKLGEREGVRLVLAFRVVPKELAGRDIPSPKYAASA
jgi:hypothetical protein